MLKFQPKKRSVVWCDFAGFKEPEIVKTRPVVVIKKHPKNPRLVYVLPISNSVPDPIEKYHHKLDSEFCKKYFNENEHWVKTDLFCTISIDRLDRIQNKKIKYMYSIPEIDQLESESIVQKLADYLNLSKQQNPLSRVNET
jgi:uncharacterized protein YifN (PemK superfamily)